MKPVALIALLILSACSSAPKPEPAPLLPAASLNEEVPQKDPYQRVAEALLQGTRKEGDEGPRQGFLSVLDQPVAVGIVGGAFQAYFPEEEAAQVADFLESPAGRAGVAVFGDWFLTGKFLKSPVPEGLGTTWDAFRSTAAGIKLFTEVSGLYKKIALEAIKVGGAVVKRAIVSDIGKEAALALFGALLKSGAFFK